MSVQATTLSGSVGAMCEYYADSMRLIQYYAESGAPRGQLPDDFVVFSAYQVSGNAAARMGLGLGLEMRDVTVGDMKKIVAGLHLETGETLSRHRAAPVYEKDPSGRYLRTPDGAKIRKIDPTTGKPETKDNSLAGIDLTVAAPKSLALAVVLADGINPALREAILQAHVKANAELIAHIQANALLGKRTIKTPTEVRELVGAGGPVLVTKGPRKGQETAMQGSRTERVAVDLAVFSTLQHTARPTEATQDRGAPPDPLIHTHNFIPRSAYDPVTGGWITVDSYALKESFAAAENDAFFLGRVHYHLVEAGVPLDYGAFTDSNHGRMTWRVAGITAKAERLYSSNHERLPQVVRDFEAKTGRVASPALVNKLMHDTKLAKDPAAKAQDSAPDYALWRADAERSGVELGTKELVRTMTETRQPPQRASYEDRRTQLYENLHSPKGLHMTKATFTAAEARSALMRSAETLDFTPEELAFLHLEVLDASVALDPTTSQGKPRDPAHVRYATREQLDREHRVRMGLNDRSRGTYLSASPAAITQAIASSDIPLDSEQEVLVRTIAGGHGVVFIEGHAGSGKTTALLPALTALKADGAVTQVIVASTAAKTARSSGLKLRADHSGSVESLVAKMTSEDPTQRLATNATTVIVFDESAMADTARIDTLLAAAPNARVVFAGDQLQAQPIGPAGWYQDAVREHGVAQTLTNVHRHSDPRDTKAFTLLREGQSAEALESLSSRGRVHISPDSQATYDQLGIDYRRHRDAGYDEASVRIVTDRSNHNVDALNRVIQQNRINHGEIISAGFAVEATKTNRGWSLHEGDAVIFLAPYYDGETTTPNGSTGNIVALDPTTGRATLDVGGKALTLKLDARAPEQPVGLAYALHTAKYQGGQAPVVLYVPTTPEAVDKFSAYSSLTRAAEEAHLYLDHETHGDQSLQNMATALEGAVLPRSAQSYQNVPQATVSSPAIVAVDPAGPPVPTYDSAHNVIRKANIARQDHQRATDELAVVRDDNVRKASQQRARMDHLERVVGPKHTKAVRGAPSYNLLMQKMDTLDTQGAASERMLRSAARTTDLTGAKDPAAALSDELSRVPRIDRAAPQKPPAAPEPASLGLEPPRQPATEKKPFLAAYLRDENVTGPGRPEESDVARILREANRARERTRSRDDGFDLGH